MNFNATIPSAPNFKWGEFFVTDHDQAKMRQEFLALPLEEQRRLLAQIESLAGKLQVIRDFYGRPMKITSGWRSRRVNAAVGGARNSYHLNGMAADVIVSGVTASQVQRDFSGWSGGLGLAYRKGFTHFDTGPKRPPFTY